MIGGDSMKYSVNDINVGSNFGSWTVVNEVNPKKYTNGQKVRCWKVINNKTGEIRICAGKHLHSLSKATRSYKLNHNLTKCDHYTRAHDIIRRCSNSSASNYYRYGGRGIKNELGETVKDVIESLDKVPGYFKGAYIDRIDVNGNYTIHHPIHGDKVWICHDPNTNKDYQCLGNLRWITAAESCLNKCNNVTIEILKQKSRTTKDFNRSCRVHGWNPEDFIRIKDAVTRNQWFYILK